MPINVNEVLIRVLDLVFAQNLVQFETLVTVIPVFVPYICRMNFFRKHKLTLIGIPIGILGGYIYFHFWGCKDYCTIRSNPYRMMAWGALMGGLVFNILEDQLKRKKKN